jgi:hypothetical protein
MRPLPEAQRTGARDYARRQHRAPRPRIGSAIVKALSRAHRWQRLLARPAHSGRRPILCRQPLDDFAASIEGRQPCRVERFNEAEGEGPRIGRRRGNGYSAVYAGFDEAEAPKGLGCVAVGGTESPCRRDGLSKGIPPCRSESPVARR